MAAAPTALRKLDSVATGQPGRPPGRHRAGRHGVACGDEGVPPRHRVARDSLQPAGRNSAPPGERRLARTRPSTTTATNVAGTGNWTFDPIGTSGAFRQATGGGNFNLITGVGPGADSGWQLGLSGTINVLQPALKVEVVKTFWGNLGIDYVTRKPTVTYRITNTGSGDAFGVTIADYYSNTPGVTPAVRPEPQPLGDLASGESTLINLRYRFELLQPCQGVILNCNFQTTLVVNMPDALDVNTPKAAAVGATAPLLPPPL